MAYVKFWADEFANLPSADKIDSDTLYFVTDTGQLFKGSKLIADKTPDSLANEFGLKILNQAGEELHSYNGSSEVKLQAGNWVQLTENTDGTITITSTDTNTTYTLSGKLSGETFVSTLTPSSGTATTSIVPKMTKATSTTDGAAGLVPKPLKANYNQFLRGDGTWATPTNTTYNDMVGATADTAGTHGLVPAPAAGKQTSFLRGDGTWVIPTDTNTLGKNIVGGSSSTANTAVTTNGVYLKHIEGTDTVKSTHKISGNGKVSVTSDASGNITITGENTTLADLGLDNAMHFLGTTTTELTEGSTANPITIDSKNVTAVAGDIALYDGKEYIFTAGSKWQLFGDEGSYLLKSKVSTNALKGAGVTDITSTTQIYAVQEGTDGKLAVRVPWVDTNTTYTASDGITLTGTKFTLTNTYAGGTAVTLNGTSKAKTTASFYAPTAVGAVNQVLISNGSGAPSWTNQSNLSVGSAATATKDASGNTITTTYATKTELTAVSDDVAGLIEAMTWLKGDHVEA